MARLYETRYYGPTDYRGSRVKATWQERKLETRTVRFRTGGVGEYWEEVWAEKPTWSDSWDHSLDVADNHAVAIRKAWPNAGTIRYVGQNAHGLLWLVEEEEL